MGVRLCERGRGSEEFLYSVLRVGLTQGLWRALLYPCMLGARPVVGFQASSVGRFDDD
jgi:hypothetical protein